MGWALPASIGSYFSYTDDENYSTIALVGDGAFMMTSYELATIKHHNIPIKIFIMNNQGYSMIQQTQDQWLGSKYYASSNEGGLSFPDYEKLADSYGIKYFEILDKEDFSLLPQVIKEDSTVICNVHIPKEFRVIPQVKFGYPNEDMEPLLPRELFKKNMIIEPLDQG